MPEYSRPSSYIDKLLFAQRVVKAAQFRHDHKQALKEMCEAMLELVPALIEREKATAAPSAAGDAEQKPAS